MTRDSIVLIIKLLHEEEPYRCRLCTLYDVTNCISNRKADNIECCCTAYNEFYMFGFDNTKHKILQLSTGKCNLNTIMCSNENCTYNIEDCPKVDSNNILRF